LQAELDKAESELAEKKQKLRALKDYIRTEAAEMVAKIYLYLYLYQRET